jgi:DNA-binding CsgD family transcriptional regulator
MNLPLLSFIAAAFACLATGLFVGYPGRCRDGTPNPVRWLRWLTLLSFALTAAVDTGFSIESALFPRWPDGGRNSLHLACLLPTLALDLVMGLAYLHTLTTGRTPTRRWLPPAAVLVACSALPLVPAFRLPGLQAGWYAIGYGLFLLLLARGLGYRVRHPEPGEAAVRILALALAAGFAVDVAIPWNAWLKSLLHGLPWSLFGLTAMGLALILESAIVRALPAPAAAASAAGAATSPQPACREALSPRENEVFELLRQGRTNQEIADLLFISLPTVKKHVAKLLDKTDSRNRVELVRKLDLRG